MTKPGSIIAFLTYFTIILNAMMSVNKMFVMLSQATASANRIAEVMNLPEERPAGASIESPIKEGVVFDDVCFSYAQPANGYTLEHISFHLKRGQVLGVIGATGSGKTTLIQLLQRFYPVDSGAIYIEGKNINAMEEEKLHSLFGVAFQSDSFFIGTIYDNIDIGRGLPEEDILRAARCAQAEPFYSGYGGGISSSSSCKGSKFIRRTKAAVIDCKSSGWKAEYPDFGEFHPVRWIIRRMRALRNAIRREYPDITVISGSTEGKFLLRNADQILVLDEGRVAGTGLP